MKTFFLFVGVSFVMFVVGMTDQEKFFGAVKRKSFSEVQDFVNGNKVAVDVRGEKGRTALWLAADDNDFPMVEYLLKKGANRYIADTMFGDTPFSMAIARGNLDIVKLFVTSENVDQAILERGTTPLMWAVVLKKFEVVKYLLENGANPHKTDNFGHTSFSKAIEAENLDILKLFFTPKNVDQAIFERGTTPLMWAVEKNKFEAVKYLLENGANPLLTTLDGKTARKIAEDRLETSEVKGNEDLTNAYKEVITLLEEKEKDFSRIEPIITSEQEQTLLFQNAKAGDLDIVKNMIDDKKVNINAQDENGDTALMIAVAANKIDIVKYLLSRGADVNLKKGSGTPGKNTALDIAIFENNLEMVKLLIEKGADVNQQVKYEYAPSSYEIDTPLINAVENSTLEVVKYLLQKKADPNMSDKHNYTPLYYAYVNSDLEKIKVLVQHGADINNKIHERARPGSWANDNTILMYAIQQAEIGLVKELIKLGANSFLENSQGENALELAIGRLGEYNRQKTLYDKYNEIIAFLVPTHLSAAVKEGNVDKVESLLSRIYDINKLRTGDVKIARDFAQDKIKETRGDEKTRYKKIIELFEKREKKLKEESEAFPIDQSLISALQKLIQTLQVLNNFIT